MSSPRSSRPDSRYGETGRRRLALIPAVIGVIALLAGFALIDSEGFLVIRFIVAIFSAIVGWYAIQARQWWWLPFLAAIIVVWNPVLPLELSGPWWYVAQYAAAVLLLVAGALIRVPVPVERGGR